MDARLNHGGAPQFPATESDLDPEMVAIAGAIIRQRTGKFEYPLFEVYLSANTAAHEYSGAVFTAQAPAVAWCCDSRGNRPLPVRGDYAILTLSPKLAGSRRALVTSTAGLCLARAANGGFGVERGGWTRSTATTAFGASRPLRRIPAIVSFLNPQPAL